MLAKAWDCHDGIHYIGIGVITKAFLTEREYQIELYSQKRILDSCLDRSHACSIFVTFHKYMMNL